MNVRTISSLFISVCRHRSPPLSAHAPSHSSPLHTNRERKRQILRLCPIIGTQRSSLGLWRTDTRQTHSAHRHTQRQIMCRTRAWVSPLLCLCPSARLSLSVPLRLTVRVSYHDNIVDHARDLLHPLLCMARTPPTCTHVRIGDRMSTAHAPTDRQRERARDRHACNNVRSLTYTPTRKHRVGHGRTALDGMNRGRRGSGTVSLLRQ
jgi:hypothetical protein